MHARWRGACLGFQATGSCAPHVIAASAWPGAARVEGSRFRVQSVHARWRGACLGFQATGSCARHVIAASAWPGAARVEGFRVFMVHGLGFRLCMLAGAAPAWASRPPGPARPRIIAASAWPGASRFLFVYELCL